MAWGRVLLAAPPLEPLLLLSWLPSPLQPPLFFHVSVVSSHTHTSQQQLTLQACTCFCRGVSPSALVLFLVVLSFLLCTSSPSSIFSNCFRVHLMPRSFGSYQSSSATLAHMSCMRGVCGNMSNNSATHASTDCKQLITLTTHQLRMQTEAECMCNIHDNNQLLLHTCFLQTFLVSLSIQIREQHAPPLLGVRVPDPDMLHIFLVHHHILYLRCVIIITLNVLRVT